MNYKERLNCNEYIPQCVIDELKRLNDEIEKLKRDKVSRTLIVPERDNSCLDASIVPQNEPLSSGDVTDQEKKQLMGKCPLDLPDVE